MTTAAGATPAGKRLEEIHAQLADAVATLTSSQAWQAMLTVASRLPTYSANNVLLIAAQRPDATRVAGYRAWARHGRAVRRGERGIAILAPVLRARTDPDTTLPPPPAAARVLAGFRVTHVFDITQTDGPDLPEIRPTLLTGAAPLRLWADLLGQVHHAGYRVADADLMPANGRTDFTSRSVTLHHDLTGAQKTKTLAHELAHIRLHAPEVRPAGCDRPRAEVEAESVAFVVTAAHGLDAEAYTVPYVAGWSGGDVQLVAATATRVLDCARTILRPGGPPPASVEPATVDRQRTAALSRPVVTSDPPARLVGR